jgi:hypothetical protein
MHMLYNSDSFTVVQFELHTGEPSIGAPTRGGYEIVDKFGRKDIFLDGALAQRFAVGAQALAETSPSAEEFDDFIEGFTDLASQPLVAH